MNISGANSGNLTKVEYLSSNGDRKVLQSFKAGSDKEAYLRVLSEFECIVCNDLYEKPLQARCCDKALCATCYFSLTNPKKCPWDRKAFTGSIQDDLLCTGRTVNNIVSCCLELFDDVQSTTSEADKSKSQAQNDAIKRFNPSTSQRTESTSRTSEPRRQSEDPHRYTGRHDGNSSARPSSAFGNVTPSVGSTDSNTLSFGSHTVTFDGSRPNSESTHTANFVGSRPNSQSERSYVLTGNGVAINFTNYDLVTVNRTPFQGRNLTTINGVVVSGSNASATTSQARQTPIVRTHNFSVVDVRSIDITTASGDIVLVGQDAENQNQVSVISSQEPRIVNNKLILGCDDGSVRLKLPNSFSHNIRLYVDKGNIVTENNYSINSGGSFHTNGGSVDVKVNSMRVNASAETRVGTRRVNFHNQHVERWRSHLKCSCHVGNVYVHDD